MKTREKDLLAVFKVWEVSSSGRAKCYEYGDLLRRIDEVCPGEAAEILRTMRHDGLVNFNSSSQITVTGKGLRYFPQELLHPYDNTAETVISSEAEWKDFRALLSYYIECVKVEDRKEYRLDVEKNGLQFIIPESLPPSWAQKPLDADGHNTIDVEIYASQYSILNRLRKNKDGEVCIGYPIEVLFDSEGKAYRYIPMALVPVKKISERVLKGG